MRAVWLRHDLANVKKRLKALEAKMAQDGLVLTRSPARRVGKGQVREGGTWRVRGRVPRLPWRAGHLLCRQIQGAGALSADLDRHLQQVAFAKPYDRKTPITAAELLNDRVVSFFEAHGIHVKSPLLHPTRAPCRRARAGGRDQHGFLLR